MNLVLKFHAKEVNTTSGGEDRNRGIVDRLIEFVPSYSNLFEKDRACGIFNTGVMRACNFGEFGEKMRWWVRGGGVVTADKPHSSWVQAVLPPECDTGVPESSTLCRTMQ